MAVLALLGVSCSQEDGLTISPSSVTVKINTPTTFDITYGIQGDKIQPTDIDKVQLATSNGETVAAWDGYNKVEGYKVGDWRVGVVVCNTLHDPDSGIKYSAWLTIHVTE